MEAGYGGASVGELLRVESLSRSYGSERIENAGFALLEGEKLGLAGRSGIGKTTIARCIMGLEKPDKGRILYKGKPLEGRDISIQMIFQNPGSTLESTMRIKDIILEGARYNRLIDTDEDEYLKRLLAMVSLSERVLSQKPGSLSGGEKARAAIARALAMKPDLLIADEITASLDASLRSGILNVLKELPASMIVISHDRKALEYIADRIIEIR